jgi:folate-dependent phosphoribosylglycinamide formyltransferase PurN
MKIVLLTSNSPLQHQLFSRLNESSEIVGVVISRNIVKPKFSWFFQKKQSVWVRTFGRPMLIAWREMLSHFARIAPGFQDCESICVEQINSIETVEFVRRLKPDIICVSGTNLLGKKLISDLQSITGRGVLNLHTGLSPYIKGGPNCTNWCLALNRMEWIGNTIMWIDPKIDTGAIVLTQCTPLEGNETLLELNIKVINHAHDLYVKTILWISQGHDIKAVSQDSISKGTTFFTRDWDYKQMIRAFWNFRSKFNPERMSFENRSKLLMGTKVVDLEYGLIPADLSLRDTN